MSIYNENFNKEDYGFKGVDTKTDVLRNNQEISDASSNDFITYKANKEFPCFNYFAASRECFNRHGLDKELFQEASCLVN